MKARELRKGFYYVYTSVFGRESLLQFIGRKEGMRHREYIFKELNGEVALLFPRNLKQLRRPDGAPASALGRSPLELEPPDLKTIVKAVAGIVRPIAGGADLSPRQAPAGICLGDRSRRKDPAGVHQAPAGQGGKERGTL